MKIILCSAKDSLRERWYTILAEEGYSLYQASSMQVLESLIHRQEQYLLLLHQNFTELQIIATLCKKPDSLRIFYLSDAPNPEEGLALLQCGAVGYANAYIAPARLLEAMKIVDSGRVWFEQEIISKFIQLINQGTAAEGGVDTDLLDLLSEREKEIALLVVEGLANQAIGDRLYISERTVKAHLGSIFRKTGATNRLHLAMMIRKGK